MKSGPSDRWEHLGALLIQRRTQLSPRFHNRGAFTESTGLSYRLIYDVEEARRTNFGASTLAAIEAAYRLAPGAIARFLAGGELEVQGTPHLSPAAEPPDPDLGEDDTDPPMAPAMRAAMLEHLPDIEALVARATGIAAAEDPDHPVPRGAHLVKAGAAPNEGPRWDQLAETGAPFRWSVRKRMKLMAIGRVLDGERRARQRGREAGLTAMRA